MKRYALVGIEYRKATALVNSLPEGAILDLVREPNNRVDRYAVQVWAVGTHVGYVAAKQVRPLADMMDARQRQFPHGSDRAHLPATLHWSSHNRFPLVQVMEGS